MDIAADHARLIALCERLATATVAGLTDWSADGRGLYVWERHEGIVSIEALAVDGQPAFELVVFDSDGEEVEGLVSAFGEDARAVDQNAPLEQLYRAARESALRSEGSAPRS
jgi:hypothetical protein